MGEIPHGQSHNRHRRILRLFLCRETQTGKNGTGRRPDFEASLRTAMSEHHRDTAFLRDIIRYDESDERRKLEKNIAQVQRDERCVQRLALVISLVPGLAIAGIAYGALLQRNFPYGLSEHVIRVFCELVLASLICLGGFAGLLAVYRWKLNRLRNECRQLVMRLLESHLGKPHLETLPRSQRASEEREAFHGAVEGSS